MLSCLMSQPCDGGLAAQKGGAFPSRAHELTGTLDPPGRQFATLTFVFTVSPSESELGILDLIQVFVEALDRSFANVCELDLVFGFDEVNYTLAEIVQAGLVLETNISVIAANGTSPTNEQDSGGLFVHGRNERMGD